MAVVGFIVSGWRAVQVGVWIGCRGVAVVDSVDGWCCAVQDRAANKGRGVAVGGVMVGE